MKEIKPYIIIALLILIIGSCKKENEVLIHERIREFYPIEVGNSIIYQLDSTVFINFGSEKVVHSYIIKDEVDSMITDNLGINSFKIKRDIRNSIDTTKWDHLMSYLITCDSLRVELIKDNQRYLIMIDPIKNNIEWSGNSYINTISNPELQYLYQWKYYYSDVNMPFTMNYVTYPETLTIVQRDDVIGDTTNKDYYFEVNYSKEVYAKEIGLIHKEFLHEAWQPANSNSNTGYYESNSYGLTLKILNRNF
jgi:hypothetical protein